MSAALPNGYVLPQLGHQALGWVQLVVLVVRQVGSHHHHEAPRAARVHAGHHPVLLTEMRVLVSQVVIRISQDLLKPCSLINFLTTRS